VGMPLRANECVSLDKVHELMGVAWQHASDVLKYPAWAAFMKTSPTPAAECIAHVKAFVVREAETPLRARAVALSLKLKNEGAASLAADAPIVDVLHWLKDAVSGLELRTLEADTELDRAEPAASIYPRDPTQPGDFYTASQSQIHEQGGGRRKRRSRKNRYRKRKRKTKKRKRRRKRRRKTKKR